ncbi:MAG: LON peptidase substrate-binding domain-containing protein [Dehalococcoidia bacterium]
MRIPLFPLNLVLFPGQTLPLHIFEERYKAMLKKCVDEGIPFGLVLVRENSRLGRGTPHAIGTYAVVTKVEEIPEGTCVVPAQHRGNCYHIVCKGDERFRVTALDRREAEYLVGDVDTYPDEPAPAPALAMVAQRVTAMFDDYYRHVVALMGGWQREAAPGEGTLMFDVSALAGSQNRSPEEGPRTLTVPALPTDPRGLSHVVATELNVQPGVKQDLLEAPSALARLQKEAEILAEETPQLEERLTMQMRRRFSAFGMSS